MQKTSVGSREAPKNLQAIRIRDSVGTTCAYRIIQAVLQLPSVRTAEFIRLRLNHKEMSSVNSDFEPNNLTSLTFTDCRISSNIMDLILANMDRLQNFSFVTHDTMTDYLPIHPYFIQAGLGIASRDTLRTLQILGCYIAEPADYRTYQYMGSLREFRVLEHVTVDLEALFDEKERERESLWTQLPKSIHTATLHSHVEEDSDKLLQHTPIGRCLDRSFYYHPMYPKLEALTFRGMSQKSVVRYIEDSSELRFNGVFVDFR